MNFLTKFMKPRSTGKKATNEQKTDSKENYSNPNHDQLNNSISFGEALSAFAAPEMTFLFNLKENTTGV